MITVVDGRLGSGKTYFCVNSVIRNYCDYDKETARFKLREGYMVISNVDGMYVSDSLKKYLETCGGVDTFFTRDFQKRFVIENCAKKIIYIIDEAQFYFPELYKNVDVIFTFQDARHLDLEFFLITPDIEMLSKPLRRLPETIVSAQRQSLRMVGKGFFYHVLAGKDVVKKIRVPLRKITFTAYRSQDGEVQKVKSCTKKYLIYSAVVVVCLVVLARIGTSIGIPGIGKNTGSLRHKIKTPVIVESKKVEVVKEEKAKPVAHRGKLQCGQAKR